MTHLVFAVRVSVALLFRAEMAVRDYFRTDPLTQAAIKNKIGALKPVW